MENAIVPTQSNYLAPAAAVGDVLRAYQAKKEFISAVLVEGVDFGTIPGAGDKPALLKPGAEKMSNFFGLHPAFEDIETIEDWTGEKHGGEPLFYYRQRCNLWRNIDGQRVLVASADGSCNSWEKKYRYRQSERHCPNCGKAAIIKGKAEYGGGWLCYGKKGGCGAKFQDNDTAITGQSTDQIKNPDVFEQANTILKMAQKRALVAAALIGTCASDYFTQDVEDYADGSYRELPPTQEPAPAKTAMPNADDTPPDTKAWQAWNSLLDKAEAAKVETLSFVEKSQADGMTTGKLRALYADLKAAIESR